MQDWNGAQAPSLAELAQMAQAARAALPAPFAALAAEVQLCLADFPSDELCAEMGIEDPFELSGLYEGTPRPERLLSDPAPLPDRIWLFRRPLLDEWAERGDVTLGALVTHVLVHELAHHFGWSDAEIAAIDPWWD